MQVNNIFESLTPDINQYRIALYLDFPDLLRWCSSSEYINNTVCLRENVWRLKLIKDFPNDLDTFGDLNFNNGRLPASRQFYTLLYGLRSFKIKLGLKDSLKELYYKQYLNLSNMGITKIPLEIKFMVNLRTLTFANNQIMEIPKEIFSLPNLQILSFAGNLITELPKEIENLTNLKELYLNANNIKVLPKEIINLEDLYLLHLENNPIEEIPVEIRGITFYK